MLQHLEAIDNLAEVARLFIIFSRRGTSHLEEAALVEACKRTAGLCSRYPRPVSAITIALSAGLLVRHGGNIGITERGHTFLASGTNTIELSIAQAKLLICCLLDDLVIERITRKLFSKFKVTKGRLVVQVPLAAATSGELLLFRSLQQIGALKAGNGYFLLNPAFENCFDHLIVRDAKLSQEELLKRLERQRIRGENAEMKVVEMERARLLDAKRPRLAEQVYRISVDNVAAGYDIHSFEVDSSPRYIEVKSSVGSLVTFQWSEGERVAAKLHKRSYFIYFVPFSFFLPTLMSPVQLLRDPIEMIEAGELLEEPCGFRVTSKAV